MAHNPATGLVYLPVTHTQAVYKASPWEPLPGHWNTGTDIGGPPIIGKPTLINKVKAKLFSGHLLAWNPLTQQEAWRIEHVTGSNGGVVSTAGNLLFQGTSTAELIAAAADTGEVLWRQNTQVGVIAAPITYAIEGVQYVAVAAGWGGATGLGVRFDGRNQVPPGRILAFKLGATASLPKTDNTLALVAIPPRTTADAMTLIEGKRLYDNHCMPCHGVGASSAKSVPDLRNLPMVHYDNFDKIVREGMMEAPGMPNFNPVLSKDQVSKIYAYVLEEAHALRQESEPSIFDPIINGFYEVLSTILVWFNKVT